MAERIPRTVAPCQDPSERIRNFGQICQDFDETMALREASRCLHCKNPRCVEACPAHVRIPDFIEKVVAGDFVSAAGIISESSSLPAICGRVCPHEKQCEGCCIMGIKFEPVAIGQIESFVADWNRSHCLCDPERCAGKNGRKVVVVGSGPSGIACARDLALLGYGVTVFEALPRPGGVLQYGIPEFRMPKSRTIDAEIADLVNMGVEIRTNTFVGRDVTFESLFADGYDAIFVGCGTFKPKPMGIPGEDLDGVRSANAFLIASNRKGDELSQMKGMLEIGKRCIVVGGGNVAMDASRTARRLGAEVTIVYRRSENELPACLTEVREAREEGIEFRLLTNPVEVLSDDNGRVRGVRCIKMELGDMDDSGRRSPVPVPGSEFEIQADSVLMALGSSADSLTISGLKVDRRGCIEVSESQQTSMPGVFAGGDVVTGPDTVVRAMVAGRKAAVAIDEYCKSLCQRSE